MERFILKSIIGIILLITLINLVSADLGNYKINSCVNIRVINNCSSNNLTEVSNNNQTFIINKQMTNLGGQTFNYTFCNTSSIDTYSFSWNPSCYDCASGNCGNSFSITSSGFNGTNNLIFQLFLIVAIYAITLIGFFKREATITAMCGMFMIALGIYLNINGVIIYQDWITQYFSYITVGLGAFFSIFAGLSLIDD